MLHLMSRLEQNVTGVTSFPVDSSPSLTKLAVKCRKT